MARKIYYVVLVLVFTTLIVSCGSSKQIAAMQQMMMQQNSAQQQSTTVGTIRAKNAAQLKAIEPSENLRAVGIARSFRESSLTLDAVNNAQIQLAQLLETSVEAAIEDYNNNSEHNNKLDSQGNTERVMTTYIAQVLKNTVVLETVLYDRPDGSMQMYVCVELRVNSDVLADNIAKNVLNQSGVANIQQSRDKFKSSIKSGLEEYKRNQRLE